MAQVGIFAHPVTGNVGVGTTAPRKRLDVQGGDVIVSGNVGVGTTNPTQALHVVGNIFSTGTLTASNVSVIGDFVTLNTVTSNTEQMVITNSGTGPGLKVTQTGAEAIAEFYDDGVLALKVADGGLIGIGTTTPRKLLDVQGGDMIVSGNVGVGTTNPLAALHVSANNILVGTSTTYANYTTYGSNLNPPSSDGRINGVSITAINKRTRTSYASAVDCVSTWTARTGVINNAWRSVCWAPELSLFVAVSTNGTGNRVITSPDGINWTTRTSAVDNGWRSVCWAPELSLFVAVAYSGIGNRVMTSPDGINWTARTSAADNDWFSVCWAPELSLFVAVSTSGTGNRVMTSPDGINWTARTSAADNSWRSVCWAPELNLFVAVSADGAGNRVMTSPDGVNWTARTSAADNDWLSVCWAPELSLFVAVAITGTGNRVMTSPDGINWTTRTSAADNQWLSVCWAPELSLFVAVAITGTGDRVMTSPDGINWTTRTSAVDNQWNYVCWAPELSLFVAVSTNGTGNRVMTSAIGMPNSKSVVKALPSQVMVDARGNVGIGTAAPLARLHVNGSIYSSDRPLITWWTYWVQVTVNTNTAVDMSLVPYGADAGASPARFYCMPVNITIYGCVVMGDNDPTPSTVEVTVFEGAYATQRLQGTTSTLPSTPDSSVRLWFTTPYSFPENTTISVRTRQPQATASAAKEITVQLFGGQY